MTSQCGIARYDYAIEPADEPAGLYRGETDDGEIVIGWIVLPDGSEVGLQTDPSGVRPAPEFSPDQPVRVDEQHRHQRGGHGR